MNKLKIKFSIWLAVGMVINICLIFFGLLPYQTKISALKDELQANREKIYYNAEQQSTLIASQRQYLDLKNDAVKKINNIFVDRQQILSFINTLETLAQDYAITQQIIINEQVLNTPAGTLPLELTLEGKYIDLVKYLTVLEQQNTYFTWKEISFQKPTGINSINKEEQIIGTDTIIAHFKTEIYWQP